MKENLLTRLFGGGDGEAVKKRPKPQALKDADFRPNYDVPEWTPVYHISDMAARQSLRRGYEAAIDEVAEIYRIAYPLLDSGEIDKAKQVFAKVFEWTDSFRRRDYIKEFSGKGGAK